MTSTEIIKKAYLQNNLDIYSAVDVWIDNNLSAKDMISIVQMDTGLAIDNEDLSELIRHAYFNGINISNLDNNPSFKESTPLTHQVKQAAKMVGNQLRMHKYGSNSNVVWSIIFVDDKPHLARKECKEETTKFSKDEVKK